MRRAIELSVGNVRAGRGGPFGAVIARDGRIIAEGVNLVTSTQDPTAHAEITAIREACRDLGSFHLTGCELYASCEPCPMCLGAIYWARLDRVFFAGSRLDAAEAGFSDARIYEELSVPAGSRAIPIQQLLRNEALFAFEEWKGKQDRVEY
ncbi:MAG: nucleoside deaminase [Acidobacteriales bacterium]|nr:MAG: nucleoside deaminase [Terriglobales bacterium]